MIYGASENITTFEEVAKAKAEHVMALGYFDNYTSSAHEDYNKCRSPSIYVASLMNL